MQSQVLSLITRELAQQARRFDGLGDAGAQARKHDAYCFELVAVMTSLSSSSSGVKHLATGKTVATLLRLLPLATPRIQRQVLSVLRRVLPHVKPSDLDRHLTVSSLLTQMYAAGGEPAGDKEPTGFGAASGSAGGAVVWLLLCYALRFTVQVRGRTDGRPVRLTARVHSSLLTGSLAAAEASQWLDVLRSTLLSADGGVALAPDAMPRGKQRDDAANSWSGVFATAVAAVARALPRHMEQAASAPGSAVAMPVLWVALATLGVVGDAAAAALAPGMAAASAPAAASGAGAGAGATDSKEGNELATCDNHADGSTPAKWLCSSCPEGSQRLCQDCDFYLHLAPAKRSHTRSVIVAKDATVRDQQS